MEYFRHYLIGSQGLVRLLTTKYRLKIIYIVKDSLALPVKFEINTMERRGYSVRVQRKPTELNSKTTDLLHGKTERWMRIRVFTGTHLMV